MPDDVPSIVCQIQKFEYAGVLRITVPSDQASAFAAVHTDLLAELGHFEVSNWTGSVSLVLSHFLKEDVQIQDIPDAAISNCMRHLFA